MYTLFIKKLAGQMSPVDASANGRTDEKKRLLSGAGAFLKSCFLLKQPEILFFEAHEALHPFAGKGFVALLCH